MGKRLAVAALGILLGGLVGWLVARMTGWTFCTIVGVIAGGIGAVICAERRGTIPALDELHRPASISLDDRRKP